MELQTWLQQWLIMLLADYAGPCFAIVIIVDFFKIIVPKARRKVVCRLAVFVLACVGAVGMKWLRGFEPWEAFVQGSLFFFLAIFFYETRLYPLLKRILPRKIKEKFRGSS